jgi:repressor LexA
MPISTEAAGWPASHRQKAVLSAIEVYIQRYDRPPTVREIARDASIRSLSHVAFLLDRLEQRGYITCDHGVSRGIHLTHRLDQLDQLDQKQRRAIIHPAFPGAPDVRSVPHGLSSVPILGAIAAGVPLDLFEGGELETLDLGAHARTPDSAEFALRVRGDSMIEEGILEGDYVLVRSGHSAPEGAIVVAVHLNADGGSERGAATLKRLRFQRDRRDGQVLRVLLCPANVALRPIKIPAEEWEREWQVQGTVTAIYRPLDQGPQRLSAHT